MKKISIISGALCMLLSALTSCNVEENAPVSSGNIVKVTVNTIAPETDIQGRTTFDGETLVWTGNETMDVLIGNSSSTSASKAKSVKLTMDPATNTFSGTVDLGSFTEADIRAVALPGDGGGWIRYHSNTQSFRARIPIPQNQVQQQDGVMNGDNFPLYAAITDDIRTACKQQDGSYCFNGIQLKWGCAVIRFNVFGTHPDMYSGEVLKKITVKMGTACLQNFEARLDDNSLIRNTTTDEISVSLTEGTTIAGKTSENGVKVYLAMFPYKNKITKIIVETDRATYTMGDGAAAIKSITTADLRGHVYRFGLNLSKFTRTREVDGVFQTRGLADATVGDTAGKYASFTYTGYEPLKDKPVEVLYYIPNSGDVRTMPVLFSFTGAERTGNTQLDAWKAMADRYGFVVINPQFSKADYSENAYQFGGVVESAGSQTLTDRKLWTYSLVEALFDYWVKEADSHQTGYRMFGHSAGGQFVGRMVMTMPHARIIRAVAANPSSWPWPTVLQSSDGTTYGWPYSISGLPMEDFLEELFAKKLYVQVGTADVETESLDMSGAGMAQGARRYHRGQNFHKVCMDLARAKGITCNFKLAEVEGVGHSTWHMVYGYVKPTASKVEVSQLGPNSAYILLFR